MTSGVNGRIGDLELASSDSSSSADVRVPPISVSNPASPLCIRQSADDSSDTMYLFSKYLERHLYSSARHLILSAALACNVNMNHERMPLSPDVNNLGGPDRKAKGTRQRRSFQRERHFLGIIIQRQLPLIPYTLSNNSTNCGHGLYNAGLLPLGLGAACLWVALRLLR